jgi:beta-ketoacyl-acyl-carrier-protein synthase II
LTRRRVVITGIGAITPLGLSMRETWEGLVAGRSGVEAISLFDASDMPVRIAGEVTDFDPRSYMPAKEARRMARCSQMAIAAAQEAVADAGLAVPMTESERVGVLVGSAIGGYDLMLDGVDQFRSRGIRRINPFLIISSLVNMPSFQISRWAEARGPISTVVTACATGTQAVGEAAEHIRRGSADVMIAGGVDTCVHIAPLAGFLAMRVLSTRNDEPQAASRPFDADRDGLVMGEGCGILVLEELYHARARGARIRAEVLGQASSSDAFHMAHPDPSGMGAGRAMQWALDDAGIQPDQVDYVNAHGTATVANDPMETAAIKRVLGSHAYDVPISSTKSMLGHTMGGAGAIEAGVCVLTMEQGVVHPTINLETPDPACDLDYVPGSSRRADVRVALSNSFGLGGQNACLVLSSYDRHGPT